MMIAPFLEQHHFLPESFQANKGQVKGLLKSSVFLKITSLNKSIWVAKLCFPLLLILKLSPGFCKDFWSDLNCLRKNSLVCFLMYFICIFFTVGLQKHITWTTAVKLHLFSPLLDFSYPLIFRQLPYFSFLNSSTECRWSYH